MATASNGLTINNEFRDLLGRLSDDEYSTLEAQMLEEGRARDKIITWANHEDTIIDGHHRYEICLKHNLPFTILAKRFDGKADVLRFIYANQAGRRNMNPQRLSYLRGEIYREEKLDPAENLKNPERQPKGQVVPSGNTAENVGESFGVSGKTIKRDEKFADAVDAIAETAPEVKAAVLAGNVKANATALTELAELPPKQQAKAVAAIAGGKAKSVGKAVAAAKPKPKPGSPKVDGRKFAKARDNVGKVVREMTALKEHAGLASYEKEIRGHLNEILKLLEAWRKEALA